MINLTELAILPNKPENEIPRDNLVAQIAERFNPNCKIQVALDNPLTGKTNLLAQFARYYPDRCISYFITDDPLTQRPHNFAYNLCIQLCEVLGQEPPSIATDLEALKNLLMASGPNLNKHARAQKKPFFYVIDALELGNQGNDKIVDALPMQFPFVYLLYSCKKASYEKLPKHITENSYSFDILGFSLSETQKFLQYVEFSSNEAKEIHNKHNGNPGSIKAVYDAKKGNPDFSLKLALNEYDHVIKQQIDFLPENIQVMLNYLGVCPTGLPINIAAKLSSTNSNLLLSHLDKYGSSLFNIRDERIFPSNETVRNICVDLAERNKQEYLLQLINIVENESIDDFLLTELYIEAQDYGGLERQLLPEVIFTTLANSSNSVSSILKRLRSTSSIAQSKGDSSEVFRWSLGVSAIKSYIDHPINHDEIDALIAIGESRQALERAYLLPDSTSKIRFIARIYSAMLLREETVPSEAKEELKIFVDNLKIEDLDKEIARKMANDIFPILPNTAISIVDRLNFNDDKNSVMDLFTKVVLDKGESENEITNTDLIERHHKKLSYNEIFTKWLENKSLSELQNAILPIESTKAKEFIIRNWCKRNSDNADLALAISLWLEIIVSDINFVIPLRGLQQISQLLAKIPTQSRLSLIDALDVPRLTSLNSPKQEWIRFNLNLCEALAEIDSEQAVNKIIILQEEILSEPLDLDIKTFCLSRILSTLKRIFPEQKELIQQIEYDFNKSFSHLCKTSANQYEILYQTLGAVVDFDLDYALIMANELNMHFRRTRAFSHIFRVALLRKSHEDIESCLMDVWENLEERSRVHVVSNTLAELASKKAKVSENNLKALQKFVSEFEDPSERATALSSLAVLMVDVMAQEKIDETITTAIQAWSLEEDLKVRISIGYQLVDIMAEVNLELAKQLYTDTADLLQESSFQGTSLATGTLGINYVNTIELMIRFLRGINTDALEMVVSTIMEYISLIPAKKNQVDLYIKLASSLYNVYKDNLANDLIRRDILPAIQSLKSPIDRRELIYTGLPVLYKYDTEEAYNLCQELPGYIQNFAWVRVLVWNASKCFLSDIEIINPHKNKFTLDNAQIRKLINIAQFLSQDMLVCTTIEFVCGIIERSFAATQINHTQSLQLLESLDQFSNSKLPDLNNIKHNGYLILGKAEVHRIRSIIFNKLKQLQKQRQLQEADINKKWKQIKNEASNIPNIADRIFVISLIAKKMHSYHSQDKNFVKQLLEDAQRQINDIPTVIDRLERLDTIAETWHIIGEKDEAQVALEEAMKLAKQLQGVKHDDVLKTIIQTAYAIDADLATQIGSLIDTPKLPIGLLTTPERVLQIETLRKQPSRVGSIVDVSNLLHEQEHILGEGALGLLKDLVNRTGKLDHPNTLNSWLIKSYDLSPQVMHNIHEWVIENWVQNEHKKEFPSFFVDGLKLIVSMAGNVSFNNKKMLNLFEDSFAGLKSKYVVFKSGEQEQARTWLFRWLKENVHKKLTICDPYFELDHLDYLCDIPDECSVSIITTTKKFVGNDENTIKRYWQKVSNRTIPFIRFTIVSEKSEDKFHDRCIISDLAGLDVGPSLNGLGTSIQKITLLSKEDAEDLEKTYVNKMEDIKVWEREHKDLPKILYVGTLPA